jgi:hypothetical protein
MKPTLCAAALVAVALLMTPNTGALLVGAGAIAGCPTSGGRACAACTYTSANAEASGINSASSSASMRAHTTDSGGSSGGTTSTHYADGDGGSDASADADDGSYTYSDGCFADADSPAPPQDCATNPNCAIQYAKDYAFGAHGVGCVITGPGPDVHYNGNLKWNAADSTYWFVGSKTVSGTQSATSAYSFQMTQPTLVFTQTMPQTTTPPANLINMGYTFSGDYSHVLNAVKCLAGLTLTARAI